MTIRRRFAFQTVCLLACVIQIDGVSRLQAQNNQPDPEQMFRQLDANQDGNITLEEQRGPGAREFAQRIFGMAKKPTTGSISKDEFLKIAEQHRNGGGGQPSRGPGAGPGPNRGPGPGPGPGAGRPPRGNEGRPELEDGGVPPGFPPFLRGVDENGDQRLSRAELRRLFDRFDALDTDKDGNLDVAELSAVDSDSDSSPVATTENSDSKPKSGKSSTPAKSKPEKSSSGPGRKETTKTSSGKSASTTPGSNAREPLAGVWRGWVVDGRGENPNAGHMQMELTVTGNRMSGREIGMNQRAREGLGEGTFVGNAQGSSGTLDATQTAGQNSGREYPGIFEVDGDTLKWCVNSRGRGRPTEFETGRGNYFMILHRQ